VLLKITKQLSGSIDGLHLGRFAVGEVYNVGTSLANYLLALGAAEPVADDRPTEGGPTEQHGELDELRGRVNGGPSPPDKAEDRKRPPGKRR
jgi:hypothetical protein